MTIVDRYLFFVEIAEIDGWPKLFQEFYLPRIAELFDKTAGIITLVAAIFSVSLLQRRREMTAIEAAGITKARILRPVFLCFAQFGCTSYFRCWRSHAASQRSAPLGDMAPFSRLA